MITEAKREVLKLFAEGRELYKKRDFVEALEKFQNALQIDEDDGPSKVFVDRCKKYIKKPPAVDWDGVYVMETK